MRKLFVLMNHDILKTQIDEAKNILGAEEIVVLSDEAWSKIDPNKESIAPDMRLYKERLRQEANEGDFLLVQGDFGATYNMVCFADKHKLIPIYATTLRRSIERISGGKIITTREFVHARFRLYEKDA
jgi:hypothetical protein